VTTHPELRLCVLGGSSPGIPVLLSALAKARRGGELGYVDVRLHGRNRARLQRIVEYAHLSGQADFPVRATPLLDEALDGATHILCMLRPGGMQGRAQDEALALRAGIPADEGIGLGGLSCFLRGRPLMKAIVEQCRSRAPNALFLQMTSPLGLNVEIARQSFGARAIGVCELPRTTAGSVASELAGKGFDPLPRGRCLGLNHQSWLYDFRDESGRDVTPHVVRAIDTERLLGIDPGIVRDMGAIPMNYMRLYFHPGRVIEAQRRRACGRGEELQAWSDSLDAAYCSGDAPDVERVSSLLAERRMNWFYEGVVPALAASVQSEPRTMPLNVPVAMHGLDAIMEADCEISSRGIRALPAPPLPQGPWEITRQLIVFERAVLSFPHTPTKEALAEALELHPLTRGHDVQYAAGELATLARNRLMSE